MKKKKRCLYFCIIFVVFFCAGSIQTQAKGKVRLNKTSATFYVGRTMTLKVKGTNKKAKWFSSNKKIATVNNKGKVTAKKKGAVVITARIGKKSYRCKVKVVSNTITKKCSHTWKAATCTKAKTCSKCGQETGFPLGHVIKYATCTSPETCTRCGCVTGPVKEHQWEEANCKHPKRCLSCGITEGSCTEHNWVEATCFMWKYCSICGDKEGNALGHNDVYEVIKQPTKTEEGIRRRICTRCGLYSDETIPELGEETPWVYNEDRTHREKTMYDGSFIQQDWITLGKIAMWGWFDDEAADAMTNAIHDLIAQTDGWTPFDIIKEGRFNNYEIAKRQAIYKDYASSHNMSPCDSTYQASFQGLPDIEEHKQHIRLSDGAGRTDGDYIACFLHGGYQDEAYDDYVYGENWRLYFGTTYASAH